jgi:hypothetical protein
MKNLIATNDGWGRRRRVELMKISANGFFFVTKGWKMNERMKGCKPLSNEGQQVSHVLAQLSTKASHIVEVEPFRQRGERNLWR